jgi:putative inorganic carbon (HCO3(-)) transporter
MTPSVASPAYPSLRLEILGALLTGLGAILLTIWIGQAGSVKLIAAGFLGAGVFALAMISGRPKAVLLCAWVVSLTYNRMYFIFEPLVGYHGGQGPYVIVSDVFLAVLLVGWCVDLVVHKRLPKPRGGPIWVWLLPFLAVSLIGVLHSRRPEWGFFELWRYVKLALVLLYFRYEVGKREWWACIGALAFAVFFQGALSVAEMASGKSGLLGILGVSEPENYPEALREEVFLGWHRATATMNHPPQLACYFIFVIPILFGLAFGTRHRRVRVPALIVGILGLAGLACTLSRWPNALMVLEMTLLLAGLVAMRRCPAKHAIATALGGLLVVGVVVFSFRDFILDRLTRDLNRSIEFRKKDDTTGLRIAMDHPMFGVGLNNYHDYLLEYEPDWQWAMQYEELGVKQQHVRPIASPHSAYLLYLAETGSIGLLAWLWFLAGVFRNGVRATVRTKGPWRVVCFSLLVGLVGLCLQQIVDFSMVFDPLLYTLALVCGLLNIAPDLFAAQRLSTPVTRAVGVAA